MSKNTSIALDEHFQEFINNQIKEGQYGSVSEVVRAGLRLLEERSDKLKKGERGEAISIDAYKQRFAEKRAKYIEA